MSWPYEMTLRYERDAASNILQAVTLPLDCLATEAVYEYLSPLFDKHLSERCGGIFTSMMAAGAVDISHLSATEFRQARDWLIHAADTLDALKPHCWWRLNRIHAIQAKKNFWPPEVFLHKRTLTRCPFMYFSSESLCWLKPRSLAP